MKHINITIDGPSGVGKTTLANITAKRFNCIHVDTGAMFRTFAIYFDKKGTDEENEQAVCAELSNIDIGIKYIDGEQHMILNGEDVTGLIRTERISHVASVISRYGNVRDELLKLQRKLAAENNVIMDGRDIGTVVLPDAGTKIFLTARPEVRAKRRYDELKAKGKLEGAELSDIEKDIIERDFRDSHREIAPLVPAKDAVIIDTSDLSIDEVAERIAGEIHGC
ncbi:MAG: (d)CMP kinase [Lachnospiraceae bacterium]|nr:(d)CMP kinase [Lachnospiraceae bacterium]